MCLDTSIRTPLVLSKTQGARSELFQESLTRRPRLLVSCISPLSLRRHSFTEVVIWNSRVVVVLQNSRVVVVILNSTDTEEITALQLGDFPERRSFPLSLRGFPNWNVNIYTNICSFCLEIKRLVLDHLIAQGLSGFIDAWTATMDSATSLEAR